jgi:hypothetical protein
MLEQTRVLPDFQLIHWFLRELWNLFALRVHNTRVHSNRSTVEQRGRQAHLA